VTGREARDGAATGLPSAPRREQGENDGVTDAAPPPSAATASADRDREASPALLLSTHWSTDVE
jgi:hypothetical protein